MHKESYSIIHFDKEMMGYYSFISEIMVTPTVCGAITTITLLITVYWVLLMKTKKNEQNGYYTGSQKIFSPLVITYFVAITFFWSVVITNV